MIEYETETGLYVLKDSDGRVGAKANVPSGTHDVPDWVDKSQSFDVASVSELNNYQIDSYYIPE